MNSAWAENLSHYPVCQVVDQVKAALFTHKRAVLSSPTGSGKSTVLPLLLMDESYLAGRKIIILEPRRIAAYATACQLARNLGCQLGGMVGYRMRLERKVSAATRIEVLTEGMLTRKIQRDPELSDCAMIIFDEFHERSLQSDLALALTLDSAESLREDLRILLMSATLDTRQAADLLGGAPQITSSGRSYPVESRFFPRRSELSLSENIARLVMQAYESETGSMLVFLPGEGDIRACEKILQEHIKDPFCNIIPLYGRLDSESQKRAIEPPQHNFRKIVLATSIAESSLTIDGIRVVIDSGLTKMAVYHPATQLERLETIPISQASAIQRAGRAGRTAPGCAWKLWGEYEDAKRPLQQPSQLSCCDLSGMMLELAAWGVKNPADLKFMEPPPEASWSAAGKYLQSLKALDANFNLTAHGKRISEIGLSVRSGHLLALAEQVGAVRLGIKLAALLDGVDFRRNSCTDISLMLNDLSCNRDLHTAKRLSEEVARRLKLDLSGKDPADITPGWLLAKAFPDRIARRRGNLGELRYLTAGGREVLWYELNNTARNEFIVALNLDDRADNAMLLLACPVEAWEVESAAQEIFHSEIKLKISPEELSIEALEERKAGAIVWSRRRADSPERCALIKALKDLLLKHGLELLDLPESVKKLQDKLAFIHKYIPESTLPDLSDDFILEHIEELLENFLPEKFSKNMLKKIDWHQAIKSLLDYNQQQEINRLLPERIKLENNREFKIDYSCAPPMVSGKLQWFFGVYRQPALFNGRLKLAIQLLSPAGRPVQTTSNIGNFWQGSYKLVRNELKGRYPKHDWPENP